MNTPVRVVLVAINGYGRGYLQHMLNEAPAHQAVLVGVVDPAAAQSQDLPQIQAAGIPVYASIDEFYAKDSADLAVFSTPIQLHCSNVITALEHGSSVLCEKPLCATVDEGLLMLEAEKKHPGKFVAIGYNWSFSPTIQELKRDILSGRYGAPKLLRTLVSWPRSHSYYSRNNWAGMLRSARGDWILDSPLNNATAHFLHNMFYLCGKTMQTSAKVLDVQAELFRLNPITSFDTCGLRCHLEGGTPVLFYSTHADENNFGPIFSYEFTNGVVYGDIDTPFVGLLPTGERKVYATDPGLNGHANKLWQCIDLCRTGGSPVCGIEAALQHTRALNGAHLSMKQIIDFPAERVQRKEQNGGDYQLHLRGLLPMLAQCYDQKILPSEHGAIPFARSGEKIALPGLTHFEL